MKKIFLKPLFLIIVLVTQSCSMDDSLSSGGKKQLPDQSIYSFSVIETKSGIKEWELEAEKADVYQKSNKTELYKPRMKFYNSLGEVTSTLTANEGTANTGTNDISMRGNVIIVSEKKKSRLTTESLSWDSRKEKVFSDDYFRQENEETIVSGIGFEYDSKEENLLIKKAAKVEQKVKEE